MIMAITLIAVAAMESLMINRENDFCWLNAMRRAMKEEMFMIVNREFKRFNFFIHAL